MKKFEWISAAMKAKGISQADLAKQLKLTPVKVNLSLRGNRNWKVDEIEQLKQILDMQTYSIDQVTAAMNVVAKTLSSEGYDLDVYKATALTEMILKTCTNPDDIQQRGPGLILGAIVSPLTE